MLRESMMVEWDHTSAICAMVANVNRGKGKQPIKPQQLNPLRNDDGRTRLTTDNIELLKGLAGKVQK
jgi:hypothetical protein|tara:strand:+ start:242 stop:442 length:201 start_codon:yes stop_codon:yes gene_type:complete